MNKQTRNLYRSVMTALFTALIIAGAYISIPLPLTPIPIVLSNFFVLLAGLMLGPLWGSASVLLYLLLGAVGLPVFFAAGGGIAHIAGPSGGYLLGFVPAAFVCGLLSYRRVRSDHYTHRSGSFLRAIVAATFGSIAIYAVAIPWLKTSLEVTWQVAFAMGLIPFIVGDVIKIVVAAFVARLAHASGTFLTNLR